MESRERCPQCKKYFLGRVVVHGKGSVDICLCGYERLVEADDPQDLERAGGLARDIHLEEAVWNLEHESGRRAVVAYRPLLASNDWLTLRKVATAGIGITAVPAHVCRNELASGALEGYFFDHELLAPKSAPEAHRMSFHIVSSAYWWIRRGVTLNET